MVAPTVRDVVDAYLRHSRAVGLHCARAYAERARMLAEFSSLHGERLVSECKAYHLTDWVEAHPLWTKPSTQKCKANIVRAAFSWAAEDERIDRNPFKRVRYQESERRPDMPDSVLEVVAALANKQFESALRFLRLTGCRVSELANAHWEDVEIDDLERGRWKIRKHKSRRHTKKDKSVALVKEAVELLRGISTTARRISFTDQRPTGPIFLNCRGTPWTGLTLGKYYDRLRKKHNIQTRASLHGVRHKFASAAVAAGAPIKLISQQLGHASVQITESYYVDVSEEMDSIRAAVRLGIPVKG